MSQQLYAVGVDVETTDLDLDTLDLLEVGLIAYDQNFEQIDAAAIAIHHDLNDLRMNGTIAMMHSANGLLEDVQKSDANVQQAEAVLCKWLDKYLDSNDRDHKPYVIGSSITFDRNVLAKHMPELYSRMHYRSIDATTVKLLAQLAGVNINVDAAGHRVFNDIDRSLEIIRKGYIEPIKQIRDRATEYPRELSSIDDYESAPAGTIVLENDWFVIKSTEAGGASFKCWHAFTIDGAPGDDLTNAEMSASTCSVERWGMN